jgi:hypothetical protein
MDDYIEINLYAKGNECIQINYNTINEWEDPQIREICVIKDPFLLPSLIISWYLPVLKKQETELPVSQPLQLLEIKRRKLYSYRQKLVGNTFRMNV